MNVRILARTLAACLLVMFCAAAFVPSHSQAGETTISPPFPTDSIPAPEGSASAPWSDPLLGAALGSLALIY